MSGANVKSIRAALRASLALPHNQAYAMPAAFYTDQEFFACELEQLFRKEWVCVGREEEIPRPGDYFAIDIANEPVLLIRTQDHTIHALANVCRHRGMPLVSGNGTAQTLLCPYHAWSYDLSGRLLRSPLLGDHASFKTSQCRLPEYALKLWRGFIFVNLDLQAKPLAPRLTGLDDLVDNYHIEEMKLGYSCSEDWQTNWKCLTENFMEGYHLSTVHYQTLHPITPTRGCEHFPAGEGYLGYFSHFPADLPERGQYHPDLTPKQRGCSTMFAIMPGLVAGVAGHFIAYICLQPLTVGSVRAKMGLAFRDRQISGQDLHNAVDLFQRTMAEDKLQLVNLQRGLQSRSYRPGPLADADYEGTVWDFYHYMARRLVIDEG